MKHKTILIAAAALAALALITPPAEAGGFRFSFGVGFSFGSGGWYPYGGPWYGPVYHGPVYSRFAFVPYRPVTVVRYYYPYTVYRIKPSRTVHVRAYGNYVPRRYTRVVYRAVR